MLLSAQPCMDRRRGREIETRMAPGPIAAFHPPRGPFPDENRHMRHSRTAQSALDGYLSR